jgi:hypothetical protein
MIDMKLAFERYKSQISTCSNKLDALGNPVKMHMTFAEWIMVWIESGQYHLYGRGKGKYCMGRYNDIGHYEVGNVKIIPFEENVRAAQTGRPKTAETRAKLKVARTGKPGHNKGKPHSDEWSAKISASLKGKPKSPEHTAKNSSSQKGKPGKPHTVYSKAKMSAWQKGVPKPKTQCAHCGMWVSLINMKRWHGDNCKKAPAF